MDDEAAYTQHNPQYFDSNYWYLLGDTQRLPDDYGDGVHSAYPPHLIDYHSTTSQSSSAFNPYTTYNQTPTSAPAFTPYPTIYNQPIPTSANVPPPALSDIDQRTMPPYLTIYDQSTPTSANVPPHTLSDIDQRIMHDRRVPTLFPSHNSPYANAYAERIMEMTLPSRRGESVRGKEFDRISIVPDSQKPVQKSKKLRLPPAQYSESAATIPPMSTFVVPQPTSSENPPASNDAPASALQIVLQPTSYENPPDSNAAPMSTLQMEARGALQRYFLLQQPMRTKQDDTFIKNLADDLVQRFMPAPRK